MIFRFGAPLVDHPAAEDRLSQMLASLRRRKIRITPQRLAVLRVLAASAGHPAVEQIHERLAPDFPTMSLATVYKTVSLLKQMGEVLELGFADAGSRYDGNRPFPHPHLICTGCRKILDPDLEAFEALAREIAAQTGFRIQSHRVDFFGLCPECSRREEEAVPRAENRGKGGRSGRR
ncbi:MAG: transcriptional repressor [Desulfobacterales bacterium]